MISKVLRRIRKHILIKPSLQGLLLQWIVALGIAIGLSQQFFPGLESLTLDWALKLQLTPRLHRNIQVFHIDPNTVSQLKGFPTAAHVLSALKTLDLKTPEAIIVDVPLKNIGGTPQEISDLDTWAAAKSNVYFVLRNTALPGDEDLFKAPAPYKNIRLVSGPKTADISNFSKDGVTRRMLLSYQNEPLLHWKVARKVNPDLGTMADFPGRFSFYDTDQAYIRFVDKAKLPTFSFLKLLESRATAAADQIDSKKIYVLGTDLGIDETEYVKSPIEKTLTGLSLAQLHATILNTLVLGTSPKISPTWIQFFLIWIFSFAALYFVMHLKPSHGLLALLSLTAGLGLIWWMIFQVSSWIVPLTLPLMGMISCYYIGLPLRLISESRKSWEYFQKNKLLSQVEELKTNFISMMSHDLKTPIARIQGMTEVILSEPVALSPNQREAIDQIRSSSEDLLKFISAILNYGRIESEKIKLHIQTKDINSIIKEQMKKHEFHAKLKKIQFETELEPLFPIDMDPDLIHQVVSNLIENAIKYSPESTKVTIHSTETANGIQVQIADQGMGIPADELPNIFDKFFRSKNAKSSAIKGTGLGLYLSKYFTELHQGQLIVESTYGQGSVFTLELPMEQGENHA